jgi:hypothetical protein
VPTRSQVFAILGRPSNILSVVGSDGTNAFGALMGPRSAFEAHALIATVSATAKFVYYLDGSRVRFVGPGDVSGFATTTITLGPYDQAGISVSPDDQRIAVAVLSYSPAPPGPYNPPYKGMRLYVEDLNGGGHHLDIFSSPTVAEFPIGWTAGKLVMAVTSPWCCQTSQINPYAATSYHVVDPATGNRLVSLCDGTSGPVGPVEPGGAICLTARAFSKLQRWDGTTVVPPATIVDPTRYQNAMSPDGTRVAVGGDDIRIWGPAASTTFTGSSGDVLGWLDADRIVFQRRGANTVSMVDLKSGARVDSSVDGGYVGTFPAALT